METLPEVRKEDNVNWRHCIKGKIAEKQANEEQGSVRVVDRAGERRRRGPSSARGGR